VADCFFGEDLDNIMIPYCVYNIAVSIFNDELNLASCIPGPSFGGRKLFRNRDLC
jgi:hypothetical protein